MKPVIIGLGLGVVALACWKAQRPGIMTKERDAIYRKCLSGQVKDPEELIRYAAAFEQARLYPQALLLRQRAALRKLPKEVQQKRREIFRRAMASKNKLGVLKVADAFDSQGATSAAHRLRQYASGLPDVGTSGPIPDPGPIVTPPPPEETEQPAESDEPVSTPKRDTDPAPAEEKPIVLNGAHSASAAAE